MPRIAYRKHKFSDGSLLVIDQADEICRTYASQGYDLTLRQLYYQFVARGLIPNKDSEYKKLGSIINDARMAGMLDWNYIVDRTRFLRELAHWGSPAEILESAASSYREDLWANQKYRPEVWIEKDALVGVLQGVCSRLDVPYFSCRGYTSQSEMWEAAQRIGRYIKSGQTPVILHFGDHDPSGMDMSRDIEDRIRKFVYTDWLRIRMSVTGEVPYTTILQNMKGMTGVNGLDFRRLALNMDQVDEYTPPPNPAKITDSRSDAYIAQYGDESWELDALEPQVIESLIEDEIESLIDQDIWDDDMAKIGREKSKLRELAETWA